MSRSSARDGNGGPDAVRDAGSTGAAPLDGSHPTAPTDDAADLQRLPLTGAQRGIWIGEKISREGTVFNIAEALEIDGPIEPARLVQAIRQVTQEAETTRTNIVEDGDGPQLVIHPRYRGEIARVDLSQHDTPAHAARAWMMRDVTAPLDLEHDALWVAALIRTGPDRHLLYQRAHHVILDGYAAGLITRRIASVYNALVAGIPVPASPFAPLRQLLDAEHAYRGSRAFARDRDYWRERLADAPEPASLARARNPAMNGLARESVVLGRDRVARLRVLAREWSCTLPQALMAIGTAFMHRSTGLGDLGIGMPVSARSKATRNVPGMAANGILLRHQVTPDMTLRSLTAATGREARRALRHQHYRYEDIRRDLGVTGQNQHFARTAINVEPFDYDLRFGGHPARAQNLANSSVEDLVIFIYDRGTDADLHIDFDANPSLYTASEIRGHARRFIALAQTLIDEPDVPIGEVVFPLAEERTLLLEDWNRPASAGPALPAQPVFATVQTLARQQPSARAVSDDTTTLDYRSLNARANQLARRLIASGTGAGEIIAVALPRSTLLPIAMLAAHKAGVAFLPVDPAEPAERLESMLGDARVERVVTTDEHAARFTPARQVIAVAADDMAQAADVSDAERGRPVTADDTAYVIFTSGSTGRPKGVRIGHGALANMAAAAIGQFALGPGDRVAANATPVFDASIFEHFAALGAGASIVVAHADLVRDPGAFGEWMRREGITMMLATPPLWEALVSARTLPLGGLKVGIGGDVLSSRLARALHDLGAQVCNLYGPTETAVFVTALPVTEAELAAPPIGRPIRGARAYVLGERLELLPPGVAGELCIGGVPVGLGYLDRPELTAERFPPDPYGAPGSRLYRTGDLARWRDDGVLEFLGRCDQQLKIRGFRVEPGEVESALLQCDGVAGAFVMALPGERGQARLAAYVAAGDAAELDGTALRSTLARHLPAHLVPSLVFVLDALPLTPSGKIDRHALPTTQQRSGDGYVAPRNDTERELAALFEAMLGLSRVGVEDNLFDLGADSLIAVQLLIEIETRFSRQLSLAALFEMPTIASLAAQMDNAQAPDPFATLFPLRAGGSEPPLFCIHSVVGVAWPFSGLLRHLGDRQPVIGLQAHGLSAENAELPSSIEALATDYIAAMRGIQPRGPYRLLGWSLGGLVAHAMAAQLERDGEQIEFLGLLDAFPHRSAPSGADGQSQEDEADLTTTALRFMNFDAERLQARDGAEPTTLAELAEFVFREFDVFSAPLVRKAGFDGDVLRARFRAVIANHFRIARAYRPQQIGARIHVFRADQTREQDLEHVMECAPGAWNRYTTGGLLEHDVPGRHFAMLNPEPLAVIGPLIREALGREHRAGRSSAAA